MSDIRDRMMANMNRYKDAKTSGKRLTHGKMASQEELMKLDAKKSGLSEDQYKNILSRMESDLAFYSGVAIDRSSMVEKLDKIDARLNKSVVA